VMNENERKKIKDSRKHGQKNKPGGKGSLFTHENINDESRVRKPSRGVKRGKKKIRNAPASSEKGDEGYGGGGGKVASQKLQTSGRIKAEKQEIGEHKDRIGKRE